MAVYQHKIRRVGDANTLGIPNFKDVFLGKNLYQLRATSGVNNFSSAIGSNVTVVFTVPFPHRLQKVELKHTDTSGVDSTDALTWSLSRAIPDNLAELLIAYAAVSTVNFIEVFGEEFAMPATLYTLIHNTTNTNRIYFDITIQRLTE